MNFSQIKIIGDSLRGNISKVMVGKENTINLVIVSLFCAGHVLLEDVPGVGKTMLAKCLAKSVNCDFKRVQFTPDLLPSDLTGINFFNQKQGEFVFRPGPIFSNIVLADEINRATPRTQSSLLECMEESQVTIDGETRQLGSPFFVIATQNPVETHGTFHLPEAQLDRFFMRLRIGYPSPGEGRMILDRFCESNPFPEIKSIANSQDIANIQEACLAVKVGNAVKDYIVNIIEYTRKNDKIALGISPRGSLALMRAAQAWAAINSRSYVTPDDIKALAVPVLAHRLVLKGSAILNGTHHTEAFVSDMLEKIQVPTEEVQ